MQRFFTAVLSLAFLATMAAGVSAKNCRDKSGKFVTCPKPTPTPKVCRDAHGKFMKCPKTHM